MKQCSKCGRDTKVIKKLMCNTCYEYARRHKLIEIHKLCLVDKLTQMQSEHIIGNMLGDGHIEMGKLAHHARLHIVRQTKDKEYIEWQAKVFNNICSDDAVGHSSFFDKRTQKTYFRTSFRTRSCPIITEYWNKWYPNGKKIVPRDFQLTPLILLIWFLDDGSCHFDYSKSCSTMRLDLNTMGFSEEENIYLAGLLSEYIKSEVKILKSKNKSYLRLNNISCRKFISIIDPIFPDCMLRKAKWKNTDCDYYIRVMK